MDQLRIQSGISLLIIATLVSLFGSLGVFAYGVYATKLVAHFPWSSGALIRLAVATAVFWSVFAGLLLANKKVRPGPALVGLGLLLVILATDASVPLAVAFVFASALTFGDYLVFRQRSQALDVIDRVLATAVGLSVFIFILSLAAHVRLNNPATYFVLFAIPFVLNRKRLRQLFTLPNLGESSSLPISSALFVGLVAYCLFLFLLVVLLPEAGHDALVSHLTIPAYLRNFGFWHLDPMRQIWAVMPMGGDLVYAAAYMFGGEYAAKLANFACFLLSVTLIYAAVAQDRSRWIAMFSVLIIASSPLAFLESATLYIENPWALLIVSSFVALLRYRENGDPRYLFASAIAFGGALLIKVIALCAVPALAAVLACVAPAQWRITRFWRNMAVAGLVGLAIAAPPYLTALIKTGNPVFPFFNTIFKSPLFDSTGSFENALRPGNLDPTILYKFTFFSDRFLEASPGAFGFTLLLLLPMALLVAALWGSLTDRLLVFAVLSFSVVAISGTAYIRYVYPVLFLSAILIGSVLGRIVATSTRTAACIVCLGVASVAVNLAFFPSSMWWLRDFRIDALLNPIAKDEFIRTVAPTRKIVEYLNLDPEKDGIVAFFGDPYHAGLRRNSVLNNWYTPSFYSAVQSASTARELAAVLAKYDVSDMVIDLGTHGSLAAKLSEIGQPIFQYGNAKAYRLDKKYRYSRELIKDTRLSLNSPHWSPAGRPVMDPITEEIRVTVNDVLNQLVEVQGNASYFLSVTARCAVGDALFRLQVNWLDAHHRFISTSISVKPCRSTPVTESAIVSAPADAAYAAAYATAHTQEPVFIKEVSFRAR